MCNPPAAVKKIGNTISQAAKDVGSAVERNVSVPLKDTADKIGKGFENRISDPIQNAADDIGSSFQNAGDAITKAWKDAGKWADRATRFPGSTGGSGSPEAPPVPSDPPPPPPAPGISDVSSMAAKRRLAALRMGLLSTISTGGQGVTTAPSLFSPTAYAVGTSGTKTALGQ